jgi:hypothetical protein
MAEAIVVVPASSVRELRHMVHKDFSVWADELATAHGDDADGFRDYIEQAALLMDTLGWDAPAEQECELRPGRLEFLRGVVSGYGEDALAILSEGRGKPLERREAIRRGRVCFEIFERIEGAKAA